MSDVLHWLLTFATLELIVAFGLVLLLRSKRQAVIGEERFVQRGPRSVSLVLLAAVLAVFFVSLSSPAEGRTLTLTLLVAGAAVLWLQPRPDDGAFGALGVRYGWSARRFEDLEEWRLTGDHLRFRLRGEWVAVDLPRGEHVAVRALLAGKCGDRESRFSA